MRTACLAACVMIAGCTGISSVRYDATYNMVGTPYLLPKGIVPVEVFIDDNGIAVSVADAELVTDTRVGTLIALTKPSPFNDEDMKIGIDHDTSFLNSVSSESVAQLQAIVAEAAKLAGRLTLQNAKLNFFKDRTKVLSDRFDPLDPVDVARVNANINGAIARATEATPMGGPDLPVFELSLDAPAGGQALVPAVGAPPPNCQKGICARVMTSRILYISVNGAQLDSKVVKIPSREIITVPVPQTVLADQKITVTLKDGMVTNYEINRKSEALGLVKTIGGIPGAFMQGVFSGLDDKKTEVTKTTDLINAQTDLHKAQQQAAETSVTLQNAPFQAKGSSASKPYEATIVTVYPFKATLAKAVRQQRARSVAAPPPDPRENEFTDKPK